MLFLFTGKGNLNLQPKQVCLNQTSKSLLCPCPREEIKLWWAVPALRQSPWALAILSAPLAVPVCLRNVIITTTAMINTKLGLEPTKNPKLLLVLTSWMKIQRVKILFPWSKKMQHFHHQIIDAYLWHLSKKYVRHRENKTKNYFKKRNSYMNYNNNTNHSHNTIYLYHYKTVSFNLIQ